MNFCDHDSPITLSSGVEIELLERAGAFLGIGAVRAGGVPLRSAKRPMFVEIRSPDAWELCDYKLIGRDETAERTILRFAMNKIQKGPMEWMVHEIRPRWSNADWSRPPEPATDTFLELELRPLKRVLNGRAYSGFSYQYHYQSRDIAIYKIMDRATWEIGETAVGNEFWMRNCFVPSIVHFENAAQFHSTEWFIPDCANPSAFQFLPLQTELQGFTFTAAQAGLLATAPGEVAHVRSLFEKPRGENLIIHLHEHCGDLSREFSTAPVEVLFCPGARDQVELANDYEAVKERVHQTLHSQIGLERERITTYGVIEEWTPADIDYFRRDGLPQLHEAGCKTVYVANHFENHMNTWGVGNMCCTVDHKIAASVGKDELRQFCGDAEDKGVRVEMWGNSALSVLTWIFDWDRERGNSDRIAFLPHEDSVMKYLKASGAPFVRNPSNAIEADHYTPLFCVLNLRDAVVRDYLLGRWKAVHDEVGIKGLFLDSSFNLSSDKFHWVQNTQSAMEGATADQTHLAGKYRPEEQLPSAILSQYHAHLELMASFQQAGIAYCNEDLGVFGVHRHGPDITSRLDNLWLWADCIAGFDALKIEDAGYNADDVFFRGLAYRMVWGLNWIPRQKRIVIFLWRGEWPTRRSPAISFIFAARI